MKLLAVDIYFLSPQLPKFRSKISSMNYSSNENENGLYIFFLPAKH